MIGRKELPFPIPSNPAEFISLMEKVWDIESDQDGNGGMTLYTSTLYPDWHDAIKVARAIGLTRTGGSKIGDDPATVYRFTNGDGITIMNDGDGIKKASRFGERK